jgi:hypothetical protein
MTAKYMLDVLKSCNLVGEDLVDKFKEGLFQIMYLNEIMGNKLQWQDFECKYHKGNVIVSIKDKEYGLIKLI